MAVRLDGREISAEIRKATNTRITDNVRLLDTILYSLSDFIESLYDLKVVLS